MYGTMTACGLSAMNGQSTNQSINHSASNLPTVWLGLISHFGVGVLTCSAVRVDRPTPRSYVSFSTMASVSLLAVLALFGRVASSYPLGNHPPVPACVSAIARSTPGTWADWRSSVIYHHSAEHPELCGVGPGSPASVSQRWLHWSVLTVIDRSWHHCV